MKPVTITIKLYAMSDDRMDASESVGYVMDGGSIQDAIIEYAADHGCRVEILRSDHDVERGWPENVAADLDVDAINSAARSEK